MVLADSRGIYTDMSSSAYDISLAIYKPEIFTPTVAHFSTAQVCVIRQHKHIASIRANDNSNMKNIRIRV